MTVTSACRRACGWAILLGYEACEAQRLMTTARYSARAANVSLSPAL